MPRRSKRGGIQPIAEPLSKTPQWRTPPQGGNPRLPLANANLLVRAAAPS